MEVQETQNSQNNLGKEERSWSAKISQFQNVLKSYNNQDNVELAYRYKYRSLELKMKTHK